jgi:hypothetical protein
MVGKKSRDAESNKEIVAAILLLTKKITALNHPNFEERIESLKDEYEEFLKR